MRTLAAHIHTLPRVHALAGIAHLLTAWGACPDGTPRPLREAVLVTPGLANALCRIGENGSAQAGVFAGMCLKELLKGARPR